jgi:hypothetical protein
MQSPFSPLSWAADHAQPLEGAGCRRSATATAGGWTSANQRCTRRLLSPSTVHEEHDRVPYPLAAPNPSAAAGTRRPLPALRLAPTPSAHELAIVASAVPRTRFWRMHDLLGPTLSSVGSLNRSAYQLQALQAQAVHKPSRSQRARGVRARAEPRPTPACPNLPCAGSTTAVPVS